MEVFDCEWQLELLHSPESPLGDDPTDEFEVPHEARWLVRFVVNPVPDTES